ncbi:lytic transglycosylase domain-containing protein [Synechococcus sp. UW105]|uniref:lytic transglycosylase domain-containing protein n=1 Tax=Synechococcus sp. UW105 TaxID=337067 RepID=UPI000E0F0965|nr:lytic transglycosylase domain-containing protein [Synechococcus sp. UW105]
MTSLRRWIGILVAGCGVPLALVAQQRIAIPSGEEMAPTSVPVSSPAEGPTLPTDPSLPLSPSGRHYPLVPAQGDVLAQLISVLEEAIRNPATPLDQIPQLAHQQQVIYRVLSHEPERAIAVRNALPDQWRWVFDQHIAARREFLAMHRGPASARVPAWRIQSPAPEAQLLRAYRSAAEATGIPWTVLAAVNLVETGMGRIDGVSVANAQGPMQFLPTTWAEAGIGQGGDIRDPWDSIHAAARYLVRRGGLRDLRQGLWGYNNSNHYGEAVLRYAALLDRDPRAYRGLYYWQIHYASAAGDLWLHEGYHRSKPASAHQHTREQPFSKPPSTLPLSTNTQS